MDKIGDIKKAFDLGDCGDGKKRSLQQKLDASAQRSVPATRALHGLRPSTLSPSRAAALLVSPGEGNGEETEQDEEKQILKSHH